MGIIWYKLIYQMNPGTKVNWLNGDFNFTLDFISNISEENIGNFLMFLPFGIIYPLTKKDIKWKNVVLKGVILVLIIEIIEPVFGRAFDVNDIFLNTLGVLVSSTIYVVGKDIVKKCSEKQII